MENQSGRIPEVSGNLNCHAHFRLRFTGSAAGEIDFLQFFFPGIRSGKMDFYFTGQLSHPGSDFDDFTADGVKLG